MAKKKLTQSAQKKAAIANAKADTTRPLVHPEEKLVVHRGDHALTVDQMKKILGWTEETEDTKFGANFFLIDENNTKVRLTNNTRNRNFSDPWARTLAQKILQSGPGLPKGKRQWQFNWETFIISKFGSVLSGQHRGVGLVYAGQIWHKAGPNSRYREIWPTEPTLDILVAYGSEETDELIRTLDITRPRTFADILYTSPYFADAAGPDRKIMTRMADYAVRLLWGRTGAKDNSFAPVRTPEESIDFLDRHPSLVTCVGEIYRRFKGTDKDNWKTCYDRITPGYATALLYLMGAAESDGDEYYKNMLLGEHYEKKHINWDPCWDKALDFWTMFCSSNLTFRALTDAVDTLYDPTTKSSGNISARLGLIVKAWNTYRHGNKITEKQLELESKPDKDNILRLAEFPKIGGIDRGDPAEKRALDEAAGSEGTEQRKAEIDQGKDGKPKEKTAAAANAPAGTARKLKSMVEQEIDRIREMHPNKILLFRLVSKDKVNTFGDDATRTAALFPDAKAEVHGSDKIARFSFPKADLDDVVQKLNAAGHTVAIADNLNGQTTVTQTYESSKKATAPKPTPKKKGSVPQPKKKDAVPDLTPAE